MPNIEVDMDQVTVEGVVIKRPNRIARSDWIAYWERLRGW
jgi:hypothetical protein